MDVSQKSTLASKNCTGIADYDHVTNALVGNAKAAYLTVEIACLIATALTCLQFMLTIFWNQKASRKQLERAGELALVAIIAYNTIFVSSHFLNVQSQLGHITRVDFLFSLLPRSVLSIVLPLCFIKPILSVPKSERPYRRVGVFPAVFASWTFIFSSLVVALDRGVTYGENHTLETLELAQAFVLFVLSMRLRRLPLQGYWPILRRSLFLVWLPPFQRLFIHSLPLSMPQWLLNGDCSPFTVSEMKDGLYGALVVFEVLAFSTSVFVFSIRDKPVVNDTEAAEPTEQTSANPNEQEKASLPESVVESQDRAAQAIDEGDEASLI